MNTRLTLHILGGMLMFFSAAMYMPIIVSFIYNDGEYVDFLLSGTITLALGSALYFLFKRYHDHVTHREAFAIVAFGWIGISVIGSLPYLVSGATDHISDALFESVSGFTTTGATIFNDLHSLPPSVLFWRCFTQWLGGMGIIVLSIAILPLLGIGGMQLFKAETPGPKKEGVEPRIQGTAKILWSIYFLLTTVLAALLKLQGMSLFDAICHAMTTMASGGFSNHNDSIGGYNSSLIQWTIIFFMFLAGVNFSLHYRAIQGKFGSYWQSEEFKFYLGMIGGAVVFIIYMEGYWFNNETVHWKDWEQAIRSTTFQVVSLISTTGYVTDDYEVWHPSSKLILLFLMFAGGCAGSTAGGVKITRILLLFKNSLFQIRRIGRPKRIKTLWLDHIVVPTNIVYGILTYIFIFMGMWLLGTILMAATGLDIATANSATMACLANIGPGFSGVGPTDNFSHITVAGKYILSALMLLGRLEFFTIFVLFFPTFWQKY